MLRIGLQAANLFETLDPDDALGLVRHCGFDSVGLTLSALRRAPIAPPGLPVDFIRADLDPNDMPLEEVIALCGRLKCGHIVISPAGETELSDDWKANMALYKPLIPALRAHGVICCLENIYRAGRGQRAREASCADPYEACDYIDELNDAAGEKRFGLCLNTGVALLTGRDIYTALMKLGPRVERISISDNDGVKDTRLAPYMGLMDWNRFVMGLRDMEYDGPLTFEVPPFITTLDAPARKALLELIAATGRLFIRRAGLK